MEGGHLDRALVVNEIVDFSRRKNDHDILFKDLEKAILEEVGSPRFHYVEDEFQRKMEKVERVLYLEG